MDARAAIASAGIAMDPLDVVKEVTIGDGSPALRARTPSILARPRDPEHVVHDRHLVIVAAIIDELESRVRFPAKKNGIAQAKFTGATSPIERPLETNGA
jgi:hypothetical protein